MFSFIFFFFFFNDTATTEIYTLSLHDALPILSPRRLAHPPPPRHPRRAHPERRQDRKSTRLNSSHGYISYAVFCLKKKKQTLPPLFDQISMTSPFHHTTRILAKLHAPPTVMTI